MARSSRSVEWIEARLRAGASAEWIALEGGSMEPALIVGDWMRVEPFAGVPAVPGEIVVARVGPRLVAHRIVAVDQGRVITRGDASAADDPPLSIDALLGRVVELRRGAKRVTPPSPQRQPSVDAPPLLDPPEVLARALSKTLPEKFSTLLIGGALRPLFSPGARLTVSTRLAPTPGAIACLLDGDRLAWRRVLAIAGPRSLLRADIAPFADGWFDNLLGIAIDERPLAKLAAHAPRLWTSAGWWGACVTARVGQLPARLRRVSAVPFSVQLMERDASTIDLQLVTSSGAGAIAGRSQLTLDSRRGYSCETFVAPRYRGLGGGKLLVAAAVDSARAHALSHVEAHVHARNFASLGAYRGAGFRAVGWWRSPEHPLLAAERQLVELRIEIGSRHRS